MSFPVYSTRLWPPPFTSNEVGSGVESYTVPAGYLAVVRDVTLAAGTDALPVAFVLAVADVGVIVEMILPPAESGVAPYQQWRGRVVVNSGEELELTADALCNATVSGYLLTLP